MSQSSESVKVRISETASIQAKPNPILAALASTNFGKRTPQRSERMWQPERTLPKRYSLSKERLHDILKLALPIEYSRVDGMLMLPSKRVEMGKYLRPYFAEAKASKFRQAFREYIVPIYEVPFEVIVADKKYVGQVPPDMQGKNVVRSPYDVKAVQILILDLAMDLADARKNWLARTVLGEDVAKNYLSYLDTQVKPILARGTKLAPAMTAVDAARTASTRATAAFNKAIAALQEYDQHNTDKKSEKRAEFKTTARKKQEEQAAAEEALKKAEARLAKETAAVDAELAAQNEGKPVKARAVAHGIFIGDYAIVIDPEASGKSAKKSKKASAKKGEDGAADDEEEEEDDEEEDEEEEGDDDDKQAEGSGKGSTQKELRRVGKEGFDVENIQLLPLEFIKRLQPCAAAIAAKLKSDTDSGLDVNEKDMEFFRPFLALRDGEFQTGKRGKAADKSLFPDSYTLNFSAKRERANYFGIEIGSTNLYFALFSIRILLANYTDLMEKRAQVLEKRKQQKQQPQPLSEDEEDTGKASKKKQVTPAVSKSKAAVLSDSEDKEAEESTPKPKKKKEVAAASDKKKKAAATDVLSSDHEEEEEEEEKPAPPKKKKEETKPVKKTSSAAATSAVDISVSHDPSSDSEIKKEKKKPPPPPKEKPTAPAKGGQKRKLEEDEEAASQEAVREQPAKKAKKEQPLEKPKAARNLMVDLVATDSPAAKKKPVEDKKRKVAEAEISASSEEKTKKPAATPSLSVEEKKKPPAKKAKNEATTAAAKAPSPASSLAEAKGHEELNLDSENILDVMVALWLNGGAGWNNEDVADVRDTEKMRQLDEEAQSLLSTVTTTNYHETRSLISMFPTTAELQEAQEGVGLVPSSTVIKAAFAMRNARAAPIVISSRVITDGAISDTGFESAAQKFITSPAGHVEIRNLAATVVSSIDLVLGLVGAEKDGVGLLRDWKPAEGFIPPTSLIAAH